MIELQKLLEIVVEKKASDLHITTGTPPPISDRWKTDEF